MENILAALLVTHWCAGIQISSIAALSMTGLLFIAYQSRRQPVIVFVTRIWFIYFYIITSIGFGCTLYEMALLTAGYQSVKAYRTFLICTIFEMCIVYLIARRNNTCPIFDWDNLLCNNRIYLFHHCYLAMSGYYFLRIAYGFSINMRFQFIILSIIYLSFLSSAAHRPVSIRTLENVVTARAAKFLVVMIVLLLLTLVVFLVICERAVDLGRFFLEMSAEMSSRVFRVTLLCEAVIVVFLILRLRARYGLQVIVMKLIGQDDLIIFNPAFTYKHRDPGPVTFQTQTVSAATLSEPLLSELSEEPLLSPTLPYPH